MRFGRGQIHEGRVLTLREKNVKACFRHRVSLYSCVGSSDPARIEPTFLAALADDGSRDNDARLGEPSSEFCDATTSVER